MFAKPAPKAAGKPPRAYAFDALIELADRVSGRSRRQAATRSEHMAIIRVDHSALVREVR